MGRGGAIIQRLEGELKRIIHENPYLPQLFDAADGELEDYYVGAGVIAQTVWNCLHGYEPTYGIGDADIIYFDSNEYLDDEKKREVEIRKALPDFPFQIDVTNEALVHQWYEKKFDKKITPYKSCEEAIRTWPTTASAVGVKRKKTELEVFAPFDLNDLFNLEIRPNKSLVSESVYRKKADKWKGRWPLLNVHPW